MTTATNTVKPTFKELEIKLLKKLVLAAMTEWGSAGKKPLHLIMDEYADAAHSRSSCKDMEIIGLDPEALAESVAKDLLEQGVTFGPEFQEQMF